MVFRIATVGTNRIPQIRSRCNSGGGDNQLRQTHARDSFALGWPRAVSRGNMPQSTAMKHPLHRRSRTRTGLPGCPESALPNSSNYFEILVSAAGIEPATHALKGSPTQSQTTTCTSSLLHARHNKINEMRTRHRSGCPEGARNPASRTLRLCFADLGWRIYLSESNLPKACYQRAVRGQCHMGRCRSLDLASLNSGTLCHKTDSLLQTH